ncbi:MAG: RluA family pseudouridine synthase [Prolixibacteraceae bacterium]|nr:RluA family pseudouridine synthase [Prolixibacteraceae bacterium]
MDQKTKNGEKPGKNLSIPVREKTILMEFLISAFPHKSRNNIKSFLKNKQVIVDGQVITQYNHPLTAGQKIEISKERIPREKAFLEYTIVYEDHHLIVIDKQAGLLSVATEKEKQKTAYSLLSRHVKRQDPFNKIFIVHRLDRETSGIMVFAKNETIKHKLQESWTDTVIERSYVAVVEGEVNEPEGTVTSWLSEGGNFKMISSPEPGKGQKAVTHYKVVKKNRNFTLLKLNLETGRKNQIRVHMKDIGHPIIGDKKYGAATHPVKRLGLHAQSLSFIHPASGKKMEFESKVPRVFQRLF